MKFADRLKKLRADRGLTQKQLAQNIFVSRSAVAKWENGLGLPNGTSYAALLQFFGIQSADLPLTDEEEHAVTKNIKRHRILSVVGYTLLALVVLMTGGLIYAFLNDDGYGFTPEMAAGQTFADTPCIVADEYVFYYITTDPEDDIITSVLPVRKIWCGYRVEDKSNYKSVYEGNTFVGYFYTFEGDGCCYNFFTQALTNPYTYPPYFDSVVVEGQTLPAVKSSYFVTTSPVNCFTVGGITLTVM